MPILPNIGMRFQIGTVINLCEPVERPTGARLLRGKLQRGTSLRADTGAIGRRCTVGRVAIHSLERPQQLNENAAIREWKRLIQGGRQMLSMI